MRILTGVQPSGDLHIGNYFGAMKPSIDLQGQGQTFLFVADYHALTQNPDPELLRERVRGVVLDWLAAGLAPEQTVLYRQSDIPAVQELSWILCCFTPVGLLERCQPAANLRAEAITSRGGCQPRHL